MSCYERIVKALALPRKRAHRPTFRIEADGRDWRLYDGDHALARFMPLALDIWSFSPFAPDTMANVEPPGKVVDLHTVHNSFVNLGVQGWPKAWLARAGADELVQWTWPKASGAALEAVATVPGPDGESGEWRFHVRYDAAWGCYRYSCDVHVRKMEPEGFEGFNLMMAGALEDRPEARRWTHSLWENADGELRRIVHSNALFSVTDYAGSTWRTRHAPYPQSWIAYAAHPVFNPAILVHNTSVPLMFATCSQLFDEHLVWLPAGQDNLEADGYFHFRMAVEFVNLPARLARTFLAQAADPVQPQTWRNTDIALPLRWDEVNSFETPVDPWAPEDCAIVTVPADGAGGVAWVPGGHTGRHSLCLTGGSASTRRLLFPTGAVCKVRPHTRYRLTAWIRTENVARWARLELTTYEYTYVNVIDSAFSAGVTGSSAWQQVTVELDSGDEAYIMPRLVLYGPGRAWFDDVCLTGGQ